MRPIWEAWVASPKVKTKAAADFILCIYVNQLYILISLYFVFEKKAYYIKIKNFIIN